MNLSIYEYYTGQTVTEADEKQVMAQIRRTRIALESLLGFTLDPNKRLENLYNELGKSTVDCFCPDTGNLDPPDEVQYAYRLYPYNPKDKYLFVDPFTDLASVKLVQGNVTIKELTDCDIRPDFNQGWAKYIERCPKCYCECDCTDCVQIAVDANWVGACETSGSLEEDVEAMPLPCLPEELLMVWATSIENEIDCSKDIKSERIGSHSYTKFDRKDDGIGLLLNDYQVKILKKYAGPLGTLSKVIVP